MTSSFRNPQRCPEFRRLAAVNGPSGRLHGRRGGFTLVEVLVIIGIILALMAILLPSVGRAWKIGQRTRMELDIATISQALDIYKQDHGDYPRVYVARYGAWALGRALIGPEDNDGNAGPGFRTKAPVNGVPQGRVYGPYLDPAKWKISPSFELLDRYGLQPILYYPANKQSNINQPNGFVAQGDYPSATGTRRLPRFNFDDNAGYLAGKTLQVMMGDTNQNGQIDTTEQPAFDGDYLLWSAGPDLTFGPTADPNKPVSPKNKCDDVANFKRSEY